MEIVGARAGGACGTCSSGKEEDRCEEIVEQVCACHEQIQGYCASSVRVESPRAPVPGQTDYPGTPTRVPLPGCLRRGRSFEHVPAVKSSRPSTSASAASIAAPGAAAHPRFATAASLIILSLTLARPAAWAQDTTVTRLTPVTVTITRDAARSTMALPFSVSRSDVDSSRVGARRGSLTDLLIAIPGLSVSNRHNPTQDPRLAIRGFGARAAFGIRGVRIVRDGVPLTLADGQTAVDFVDLETVGSAEVLRGAAGALYGNASGGVLELRSPDLPREGDRPTGELRSTWNSDATRLSGRASAAVGGWGMQGSLTRNTGDGPRDYSRFRSTSAFGDAMRNVGPVQLRAQFTWYDAPLAQNPGAVTIDELGASPAVADSLNITRRAGKEVGQQLLSLAAVRDWSGGQASATVFGGWRDLYNPLAFAIIDLQRRTMGITTRISQEHQFGDFNWRFATGVDVQSQRDDRRNFNNCAGVSGAARTLARCPSAADQGAQTIHQFERVVSAGIFARAEVSRNALSLTGMVRGDRTGFTVRDRQDATSTTAESVNLGAVTPMVGLVWRANPLWSVYGNFATSFETPTTTELANQPDGSRGFNRDLKPQYGRSLEAGTKGIVFDRVMLDVAVFNIDTDDELIPFEIPNSGGRRYFRNAGRTQRRGAELGLRASFSHVDVGASLTALRYTYEDFTVGTTVLDGHRVPGVSPLTSSMYVTARRSPGFVTVEVQNADRTAADDVSANYAPPYSVWNVRMGLTPRGAFAIAPTLGIENTFDKTWVGNIVTNATRGRFFEPGAGRRVYVALRASMRR